MRMEKPLNKQKIRILYVTLLWSGFKDVLYSGLTQARGMPAFIEPLRRLIEQGHEVDIVIVGENERPLNIGPDWLKSSKVFWVNQRSFLKLFPLISIIRRGNYDFIYGHGGAAGWGNLAAILSRKPCGVRVYGTFLAKQLQNSWLRIFLFSDLEVLTHNLPKKFMLITNDGTKGDLVNKRCCLFKGLYDFKFWLNGVDIEIDKEESSLQANEILELQGLNGDLPFLLYPARYDPWKRHDLALEILRRLCKNGQTSLQLLCCGHIYDKTYYATLAENVKKLNLVNRVKLSEPLPKEELQVLYSEALATFSLYDQSNLGNVLIEAAVRGAVIIARNDRTTDFIIKHGDTGFLVDDSSDAAYVILSLLADPAKRTEMSSRVKKLADSVFQTWEQRSEQEIELILKAIGNPR